ncbi:hypothetical protein ACH4RD_08770 [Streptomyces galbus]
MTRTVAYGVLSVAQSRSSTSASRRAPVVAAGCEEPPELPPVPPA